MPVLIDGVKFDRSQPFCDDCWFKRNPDREPYRLRLIETERCCMCNTSTRSGIYVRVDPRRVAYPTPCYDDECG